jgi:flagellar biosynthetic protein FliR
MVSVFREIGQWIPGVFLLSVRIAAAMATLPAPFGGGSLVAVRAAFGVMVAIVLGVAADVRDAVPLDPFALAFAALSETLLGIAIGLVARAAIASAEAAGELAGGAIGMGFASTFDPSSGEDKQLPAAVLGGISMLLFLSLGGHHMVLSGLAASVRLAPPGAAFGVLSGDAIVALGGRVIADGLRLASPILATMLGVQVGIAIVARSAARIQIFPLSFAAASAIGFSLLALAAPAMVESVGVLIGQVPERLGELLGG